MKAPLILRGWLIVGWLLILLPVGVWASHVHVQIVWRQETLALEIFDFDEGAFPPSRYPLLVGNAGMVRVPADPAFHFLGDAGATVFVLPQSSHPELVFLGIGVDPIPSGILMNNRVRLRLIDVSGHGHFSLYQVGSLGNPSILFQTLDPISEAPGFLELTAGAHEHYNWAFTAPGDYHLTFIAEATRAADNQPIASEPATYRFRVLPPPAASIALEQIANGQWQIRCRSRPGARLRLLESTGLDDWQPIAEKLLTEPTWLVDIHPLFDSSWFWRVEEIFP
jgi:surface-anchored protein